MSKFFQKMKKNKKGFTLVELIVVVAILGVLAAVATPLVSAQIGKAQKATDDANATTIASILKRADVTAQITDGATFSLSKSKLDALQAAVIQELGSIPVCKTKGFHFVVTRKFTGTTLTTFTVEASAAASGDAVPDGGPASDKTYVELLN